MHKPTKDKRGRAAKYDWEGLLRNGFIFVPRESGHARQGCSLRSAARAHGLRVSACMATTADGAKGYLVELRK